MKKLPISVSLVSGAEASRIGRALASVADWTSEIVVVLNEEVKDGTEEIVRQHGGRVFREPWKGFLAQKNSAAEKSSQDWIFNLDADEVVSAELRQEIQKLFDDPARLERFAAFSCPRLSWYCGRWIRHGDWYPDRQTRLWRQGRARWGGIDPHAHLVVDGPVGRLGADLQHYTADSINSHLQKIIPYSHEFVKQRGNAPGITSLFHLVARPGWRFLRSYFLKLGFLDGWQGYYIARHIAFSTLVRYAKVREARLPKGPKDPSS